MTLPDDGRYRTVWKRSRAGADHGETALYCGGPNYASLYHEQQREAQEREEREEREESEGCERQEAEAQQRAEQEARAGRERGRRQQHAEGEDDDIAAAAERRNDRYAMGLLHQDGGVWGGGPSGSGVLG